ncbi:hypothetical protein JTE90_023745 [Oedothorax gibbosus]|uniref:Uncharacterized protein n=1 Tax=Oedothorax gibbosus TaxID=931172 RepID=A0AAV6UAX4_9ARAC|nr:hypothetical protein JTE90_023745 [Oedothorax gibbosus]
MSKLAITAGGLASDFGVDRTTKESEYYLLVRAGWTFDGMAKAMLGVFTKYEWTKIVSIYEEDARQEVTGDHYCYLSAKALFKELDNKSFHCKTEQYNLNKGIDKIFEKNKEAGESRSKYFTVKHL